MSHVETCYRLDLPKTEWLAALAASSAALIERPGSPVVVLDFACSPLTFRLGEVAVHGPPEFAEEARAANADVPEPEIDLLYRGPGFLGGTLSETVFRAVAGAREAFLVKTGGRTRDVLGWRAPTGQGAGLMVSVPLPQEATTAPGERRRWSCLTAHMGAGLRLRERLAGEAADALPVEAVLDGGGRLHDASGGARAADMREALRRAVLAMDHARTAAGRAEAETALGAWQGLVEGRWSLLDRFESDGRRFVVAVRNDPEHPDPRGLSQRERQVAELVGRGLGSKRIAYALGATVSSVENSAARAVRKLGLANRAELAGFFSPAGLRAKLAEATLFGERMIVGTWPRADADRLARLTPAEREVAGLIVQGFTNAGIAAQRGASAQTVAAQVTAIYRKLGARSRSDLAARLLAGPDRPE